MTCWILDPDGTVRGPVSVQEWAPWFEASWPLRRIEDTEFAGLRVSTVFLGTDYNFWGSGPPLLFETMVFGGEFDGWQWRYLTTAAARAGHRVVVYALLAGDALDEVDVYAQSEGDHVGVDEEVDDVGAVQVPRPGAISL